MTTLQRRTSETDGPDILKVVLNAMTILALRFPPGSSGVVFCYLDLVNWMIMPNYIYVLGQPSIEIFGGIDAMF